MFVEAVFLVLSESSSKFEDICTLSCQFQISLFSRYWSIAPGSPEGYRRFSYFENIGGNKLNEICRFPSKGILEVFFM